jgi:hypothetical protein
MVQEPVLSNSQSLADSHPLTAASQDLRQNSLTAFWLLSGVSRP